MQLEEDLRTLFNLRVFSRVYVTVAIFGPQIKRTPPSVVQKVFAVFASKNAIRVCLEGCVPDLSSLQEGSMFIRHAMVCSIISYPPALHDDEYSACFVHLFVRLIVQCRYAGPVL